MALLLSNPIDLARVRARVHEVPRPVNIAHTGLGSTPVLSLQGESVGTEESVKSALVIMSIVRREEESGVKMAG